jgi:hypothetical protein
MAATEVSSLPESVNKLIQREESGFAKAQNNLDVAVKVLAGLFKGSEAYKKAEHNVRKCKQRLDGWKRHITQVRKDYQNREMCEYMNKMI